MSGKEMALVDSASLGAVGAGVVGAVGNMTNPYAFQQQAIPKVRSLQVYRAENGYGLQVETVPFLTQGNQYVFTEVEALLEKIREVLLAG